MLIVSDLIAPKPEQDRGPIIKGPNIGDFPEFPDMPDSFQAAVLLKTGDNTSTDDISPAGARVLPYRSNIPKISEFTFYQVDETFL